MTTTTTEAPTAQADAQTTEYAHPQWCDSPHGPGEPHQSGAFSIEGIGKAFLLSLVQEDGEEPRILLETETLGDASPVLVDTFDPEQAQMLHGHIYDLLCLIQRCDCGGDYMCPGSPDYREAS